MSTEALSRQQAWLLLQRRLRRRSMQLTRGFLGTIGQAMPVGLKRALTRRVPRAAFLFSGQGEFEISDFAGGLRVAIDVNSAIERQMLAGLYEPEVTHLIRERVATGAVCVDVGANVGGLSLILCERVGQNGRVFCFEPGPRFFERLRNNLARNERLAGVASLHNLGVSDREGTLYWQEDPHFPGNAWMLAKHGVPVEVTTLDAFFEKSPPPRLDLIKIDVEGMEGEVLRGAEKTLAKYRPEILFETLMEFEAIRGEKVREETLAWLKQRNYRIHALGENGELREAVYPHLPEMCLATPE
jgi:FkbM family methyltransferase